MTVIDDITTTADGVDTYHLVKSAGRYKSDLICFWSFILFFINLLFHCELLEELIIQTNTIAVKLSSSVTLLLFIF